MINPIVKEYKSLLEQKQKLEFELSTLPQGYISQKNIKGKSYCYLQQRLSGKLTSRYLKADEVTVVTKQITLRKRYEAELPQITARLGELEQAAHLMDKNISRGLLRLRISAGMDGISTSQKELSFSFASAMNAIEGVPITGEAAQEIARWQDGYSTFLSAFESTLKRYGFPTEVR